MMKKILVAMLISGFSTQLVAGTLLQSKTYGGFVHEDYRGGERGVRIEENGQITGYYKKNYHSDFQYISLGQLSPVAVQQLKSKVQEMPDTQLVFPDEPECADAPDTSYSSPKYNDRVFALKKNCRTGYLAGFWQARDLKNLLSSLDMLNQIW